MTPEQAIEIFCVERKHRHMLEKTIAVDRLHLGRFADWFKRNHACAANACQAGSIGGSADLREATLETLLGFHRWIKRHKRPDGQICSIKYQNRHVRVVKQLFKLLADRNHIMTDIGKHFPPLHDPEDLPRGVMNKDQIMSMLQQPYLTTPLGFRDRSILEVLYSTGLRSGELCRLTLYDLDLPGRTLRVLQGKGKKDRVVPIGKVAAGYLAEYIKNVRPVLLGKNALPLVFLSSTGKNLRTGDLGRVVKMYRDKAHLPDSITTHSLRHTCATEMLKGGASIRHVQELLGHADIKTTQIYTHVVPTDLKKAHARTAPSERRRTVGDVSFSPGPKPTWNDKRNKAEWRKLHMRKDVQKARKSGKE